MAKETSNALFDSINQSINAAKEEFKKGFNAAPTDSLDKKIEQIFKKDLLEYAQSVRTRYHFLLEDAPATARSDRNILDRFREIIPITTKRFDELDKSYADLAPSLAKNIKSTLEIQAIMQKLAVYQKGLKGDLAQKEDALFKDALEKSVLEANKDKKESTEKQFQKKQEALSTSLNTRGSELEELTGLAEAVNSVAENLNGDGLLEPLSKINFPALKINFQNFAGAVDELFKNISENVKTFDKAKETAFTDYLKIQVASATPTASGILDRIFGTERPAKTEKQKSDIEKAQAKVDDVQADIEQANAKLTALKTILANKQGETQTLAIYNEALDQTQDRIEALKAKKDHLHESFGLARGGDNFRALAQKLSENGKTLLNTVKDLESVCRAVSAMSEKLSAKDTPNDVQEYLNQLNKSLAALSAPLNNFSLLTLKNIRLLEQLQSDVESLYQEYFEDLNILFDSSALHLPKLELSAKKKKDLDLKQLKSDLNSSVSAIKEEIADISKKLEELSQTSLVEKNKVEFLKSIGVAA